MAVGYRAQAALGLACLEWIIWRLDRLADTQDARHRLEAAWAGILSTAYAPDLDYTYEDEFAPDKAGVKAQLVLQSTLISMETLYRTFIKGKLQMTTLSSNCVAHALHILPKDCGFTDWYAGVLANLTTVCPRNPQMKSSMNLWDYQAEPAIPRSWFEKPADVLEPEALQEAWRNYLAALRPEENPYLKKGESYTL